MTIHGNSESFLISRYNIFVPKWRNRVGTEDPQVYLDWCARRVPLFMDITLPSILAQTEQKFTWLIYFDTEINPHIELVLEGIKPYKNIEAVFFDNRPGASDVTLVQAMGLEVAARTEPGRDIITTTRLDTDDALHKDYFAKLFTLVQKVGVEELRKRPIAIAFPFGVQEVGNRILAHHQDGNAFITLVEAKGPQPKTVYARDHHRIQDIARMHKVTYSQPLWMQVIHEGNFGNSEKAGLPELGPRDALLRAFGRPAVKTAVVR